MENDLKSVQDFGGGRFEVTFRTKAAVDRFLADPVLKLGANSIRFEFRGLRTTVVRVLGYPAYSNDHALWRELEVYGKVLGMESEIVPGFKEVSTGNRRFRMVMSKAVPNLFKVDGKTVQCEYEGVVRLCRRCNFPGHHASECTTQQCERCDEWGHLRCKAACKRCGGDHAFVRCKVKTYSSVAQRSSSSRAPDSAESNAQVESAPNPADTQEGGKGSDSQAAPNVAEVQEKGEAGSESAEAPSSASPKSGENTDNPPQAPSAVEVPGREESGSEIVEAPLSTPQEKAQQELVAVVASSRSRPAAAEQTTTAKGRARKSRRRKRGGERARTASASCSETDSSDSEGASPEYKRSAVTAEDEDSSSTVIDDAVMEGTNVPCPFCSQPSCDCSELSDQSYASTPASPLVGETVA